MLLSPNTIEAELKPRPVTPICIKVTPFDEHFEGLSRSGNAPCATQAGVRHRISSYPTGGELSLTLDRS